MESPLQEQRLCPACPNGIIAPADLHLLCFGRLGRKRATAGLEQRRQEEDAAPAYTTSTPPDEASPPRPASASAADSPPLRDEEDELSLSDGSTVFGAASIKLNFP